jgi:hypothetical protein
MPGACTRAASVPSAFLPPATGTNPPTSRSRPADPPCGVDPPDIPPRHTKKRPEFPPGAF